MRAIRTIAWRSTSLLLARWCSAAWVGAAVLFVLVSLREVTYPEFSSSTKDHLALLRFPVYYLTGAALLGLSTLTAFWARKHPEMSRLRSWIALGCLGGGLGVMLVDYLFVYQPLSDMIRPPGHPRTEWFATLHSWSLRLNALQVLLCWMASWVLSWPSRHLDQHT
ncbi:MAG: hypothetical protein KatS3mg114_1380 [Planctomycetaceae bacterium]|nr:MAG: hypothetical protein KatS3mg114_1380 [Planctomycetaceae bacterium]